MRVVKKKKKKERKKEKEKSTAERSYDSQGHTVSDGRMDPSQNWYQDGSSPSPLPCTALPTPHQNCGNTRSLSRRARPGIEPASSQRLFQVLNPLSHYENLAPHFLASTYDTKPTGKHSKDTDSSITLDVKVAILAFRSGR